jgi:hypothetical protein
MLGLELSFVHWMHSSHEIMNMQHALSWCSQLKYPDLKALKPIVVVDILHHGLGEAWQLEEGERDR